MAKVNICIKVYRKQNCVKLTVTFAVLSLANAKLEFFERSALFSSQFSLDQHRVRVIASHTIFNTQPFVPSLRHKIRLQQGQHK